MEAAWLWARATTRRSLDGLVLIAILAGVSGAVVLIALVGAQRTRSVLDRAVAADDPGLIILHADDPSAFVGLQQIPSVRAVLPFETFIGDRRADGTNFELYMSPQPFGTSLDRSPPTRGRRPSAADEVMLTEWAAADMHLDVGDTFSFNSQSWAELRANISSQGPTGNEPPGPLVSLKVVGIGSSLIQKVQPDPYSGWVSEDFAARYDDEIAHLGGTDGFGTVVFVWVDDGEAGIDAVQQAMDDLDPTVTLNRFSTFAAPARLSTGTMASGALVFAITAAVAAAGAIAVAVLRHLAPFRQDVTALEAMGVTRGGRALLAVSTVGPAAVAAGVVTVAATLVASRLMPFGTAARRLDPDVGAWPSWPVLLGAGAAVVALIIALALLGSRRETARRAARPGQLVSRIVSGPAGRWPTVTTGVGFALEGRGTHQAGVVRAALVAGILGVTGVVGGASAASALNDLHSTPARWGYTWSLSLDSGDTAVDDAKYVLAAPGIAGSVSSWAISSDAPATVNGVDVRADALDVRAGSIAPAISRGRAPASPSEVVLSSSLAADLHISIGDSVTATTDTASVPLTVVGEATLYPVGSDLLRFPAVLVTPAGQAQIARDQTSYRIALQAAHGLSADELYDRLSAALGADLDPRITSLPSVPSEIKNAVQLRSVAFALALFTGSLGLALVTNVIFVTRTRRGRDLVVLAALGTTPAQTVRVIVVQSATIATISLLVGVPLGAVAGHVAFARIAEHAGTDAGPVAAWRVIATTVGVVLALVPLIAAWPAWRAARLQPATLLHGE